MLYKWTRKLHMYAGLFSFMAFIVWGITGIHGSLLPAPEERAHPDVVVRSIEFEAPSGIDDRRMANRMIEAVNLPFLRPGRRFARGHDNRLSINYYTPNGQRRVVLYEAEKQLKIEVRRNSFFSFLSSVHVATLFHSQPEWPLRAWGLYNEFSLWACIFMAITGVYMWLATRPDMIWARYTTATGVVAFLAMYWAGR